MTTEPRLCPTLRPVDDRENSTDSEPPSAVHLAPEREGEPLPDQEGLSMKAGIDDPC